MAWAAIIMGDGNPHPYWEYDNADTTLGAVAGVRQFKTGTEVYTKTRRIGSTKDTMGELSKTFWDNHYTTYGQDTTFDGIIAMINRGTDGSLYNLTRSE